MKKNLIQFAVVREDSNLLVPFFQRERVNKILMICSGGCSALTFRTCINDLDIDLIDFNENQINFTKNKVQKVIEGDIVQLDRLNSSGNFETLFRQLSAFMFEFVVEREVLKDYFQGTNKLDMSMVFSNPYWKLSFDLFFSDAVLHNMFGPEATQHSPRGSYPAYFRNRIEAALVKKNFKENYFLHHLFLDEYLEDYRPTYYKCILNRDSFSYIYGQIDTSLDLSKYDFIDISNILDWMNRSSSERLLKNLIGMKPGAYFIFRQLNNQENYQEVLSSGFTLLKDESERLTYESRSIFYEKISLYQRN